MGLVRYFIDVIVDSTGNEILPAIELFFAVLWSFHEQHMYLPLELVDGGCALTSGIWGIHANELNLTRSDVDHGRCFELRRGFQL